MAREPATGRKTVPLESADFIELVRRVRMKGGERAQESCKPTVFTIPAAVNTPVPSDNQAISSQRQDGLKTTGCGLQRKLRVAYPKAGSPGELLGEGQDVGFAIVCADDDAVALWPRFAGRREESRAPSI